MRSRSTDWLIEKSLCHLPYEFRTTSTMRQYRDEHLLIFQPHPLIFKCTSHVQLHPQKHGHRSQRTHTGCWRDGKPGRVCDPSIRMEARAEPIDRSNQPETNNLLLSYGFRCSTREIGPSGRLL